MIFTCIGLNIVAGDQYVAIVMPSRVYRLEFARARDRAADAVAHRRGRRHRHLAAGAVEQLRRLHGRRAGRRDGRLPAVRFFNLLSPVISLIYGFTGFHIERVTAARPTQRPTGRAAGSQPAEALRRWRARMTADAAPAPSAAREPKRGFALPSAYTILFILIVLVAIATWIIPAGSYDSTTTASRSRARTTQVDAEPAADHRRFADGADQRPVRHRGPRTGASASGTPASCSAPSTSRCSSSSSAASSA